MIYFRNVLAEGENTHWETSGKANIEKIYKN
jgi:hypothetical protein